MSLKFAALRAKKRYSVKPHKRAFYSQTLLNKFISNASQTSVLGFNFSDSTNQQVPSAINLILVEDLVNNANTTYDDKLARAIYLYIC